MRLSVKTMELLVELGDPLAKTFQKHERGNWWMPYQFHWRQVLRYRDAEYILVERFSRC